MAIGKAVDGKLRERIAAIVIPSVIATELAAIRSQSLKAAAKRWRSQAALRNELASLGRSRQADAKVIPGLPPSRGRARVF
jgi:high-affinity Fe2+/Pb2+ permease